MAVTKFDFLRGLRKAKEYIDNQIQKNIPKEEPDIIFECDADLHLNVNMEYGDILPVLSIKNVKIISKDAYGLMALVYKSSVETQLNRKIVCKIRYRNKEEAIEQFRKEFFDFFEQFDGSDLDYINPEILFSAYIEMLFNSDDMEIAASSFSAFNMRKVCTVFTVNDNMNFIVLISDETDDLINGNPSLEITPINIVKFILYESSITGYEIEFTDSENNSLTVSDVHELVYGDSNINISDEEFMSWLYDYLKSARDNRCSIDNINDFINMKAAAIQKLYLCSQKLTGTEISSILISSDMLFDPSPVYGRFVKGYDFERMYGCGGVKLLRFAFTLPNNAVIPSRISIKSNTTSYSLIGDLSNIQNAKYIYIDIDYEKDISTMYTCDSANTMKIVALASSTPGYSDKNGLSFTISAIDGYIPNNTYLRIDANLDMWDAFSLKSL